MYNIDWRVPNTCLSIQAVSVELQWEEEGCSMQSFQIDSEGARRRECSLVARHPSVIQVSHLPLSQMVTELPSFSLSPSLLIFFIHMSTSFILFFSVSYSCFSLPLPFFPFLLSSLAGTPLWQVLFWLSSCGGFSLLWLYSTFGLHTQFQSRAFLPRKTWTSLSCSVLGKTRLSQGEAWCGKGELGIGFLNIEYAWFKEESWKTWARKSRIRLPSISSKLLKGQQSRGANIHHTSFIVFHQETNPNALKGTPGAVLSHQGKQWVTNSISCLEVWWMHWCDYFRNFSLKEKFKESKNNLKSDVGATGSQEKRKMRNRYY